MLLTRDYVMNLDYLLIQLLDALVVNGIMDQVIYVFYPGDGPGSGDQNLHIVRRYDTVANVWLDGLNIFSDEGGKREDGNLISFILYITAKTWQIHNIVGLFLSRVKVSLRLV